MSSAATHAILPGRGGLFGTLSDVLWRNPRMTLFLMLAPPLLWLGVIYLGSLFALLAQSFFSIDEFSGLIKYEWTLKTYGELLRPANLDIIVRTVSMAVCRDARFGGDRLSHRLLRGALRARQMEGAVLSRRHAALVVELSRQGLCLETDPRQGRHPQLAVRKALHLTPVLEAWLAIPVIGGNSLSVSYTGTFLVFVYVWLPYMILPTQAALERVPESMLEASSDLGGSPSQTFRTFCCRLPCRASSRVRSSPSR